MLTVDNSQYSPEQEDNNECDCLFTFSSRDSFQEDEVKGERRVNYCTIKHLNDKFHSQSAIFSMHFYFLGINEINLRNA